MSWGTVLKDFAPLVTAAGTICGAMIAGYYVTKNVNRTQRMNMKTENEKFKRDLERETADEIIDSLYRIRMCFIGLTADLDYYREFLKAADNRPALEGIFHEQSWRVIENGFVLIEEVRLKYQKREIILNPYLNLFKKIADWGTEIENDLWEMKKLRHNNQLEEFRNLHDKVREKTKLMLEDILALQRELQNDFLSHIFKRRLDLDAPSL